MSKTLIIGGGQAGGRCAMTLRAKGYEGDIVLVGEEARPPYRRPPLSKTVLLGDNAVEDGYFRSLSDYVDNGIEVQLERRITGVDAGARTARYEDGGNIDFDHLVFTTGATPRRLPVPGRDLDSVLLLRTAEDALAIKERLGEGRRIVIVGGGFIGLEVAASARRRGCEVTVLEAEARILTRSLPEPATDAVARVHQEQGVTIRTGVGIEAFEGSGTVARVALTGGEAIDADAVVVGIGIVPETRLAEAAGAEVNDGIITDEHGGTSLENVYAAGDCACPFLPRYGRHIRLESFQNADQQGANVATTIAGQPAGYDPVPFVWSDQYDRVLQTAGFPAEGDRHVQRGTVADGNLVLFSLREGRLVGVTGWGHGRAIAKDVRFAQALIQKDARPDPDQLADPSVSVKDLAPKE